MENNNFKPFPFEQLKQKKEPEKTAVAIAYEPGEKKHQRYWQPERGR